MLGDHSPTSQVLDPKTLRFLLAELSDPEGMTAVTFSHLKMMAVTLSNTMYEKSQLSGDQLCKFSFLSNPSCKEMFPVPLGPRNSCWQFHSSSAALRHPLC